MSTPATELLLSPSPPTAEVREEWGVDIGGDGRYIVPAGSRQAALDRLGAMVYAYESAQVTCSAALVSRTVTVTSWTLQPIPAREGR